MTKDRDGLKSKIRDVNQTIKHNRFGLNKLKDNLCKRGQVGIVRDGGQF